VRVFQVPRLKARRPSTAWAEEVAGKFARRALWDGVIRDR